MQTFLGELDKPCVLVLVDDTEHEEDEELRLVLGSPKSESPFGASVGKQNETLIKIKDDADSETKTVLLVHLKYNIKLNVDSLLLLFLRNSFNDLFYSLRANHSLWRDQI